MRRRWPRPAPRPSPSPRRPREGQGRGRGAARRRPRPLSTSSSPRPRARIAEHQVAGLVRCRRHRRRSDRGHRREPDRRRASPGAKSMRPSSAAMADRSGPLFEAPFWALARLIIFLGIVVYLKVPGQLTRASTSAPRPSATSSTRRASCARKPRPCLPNISARPREAEAEAEEIVDQAQARGRGACRRGASSAWRNTSPAAPGWPSRRSPRPRPRRLQEVRALSADVAIAAAEQILAEPGQGRRRRRAHRQLDRRGEIEAELTSTAKPPGTGSGPRRACGAMPAPDFQ